MQEYRRWRGLQSPVAVVGGRVGGLPVVPVRLVADGAGLAGGEAVVHIQRDSCGLSTNDRSGGASEGLL
jgi:hypothetical protein